MERLKLKDGVIWRQVDGELVAMDGALENYLGANASGLVLWEAVAEGTTRDELVALLAGRFGLEPEHAARDVDAFVAQLAEHGLLET
jgi:hypothetical protein